MTGDSRLHSLVASRAGFRCEYCQLPQERTRLPFQLDHVIASKHQGSSDPDNLALACLHCNSYKGPNLAGLDHERNEVVRLFNPRADRWDDHFEWHGPVLKPRTSIGTVPIAVLRIKLPIRVAVRTELITEGVFPHDRGATERA